jgi:thermosome
MEQPENIVRQTRLQAQESTINAGITLFNLIKTTLGPKGMDKLLVNPAGKIITTNDGVTILSEMQIDHPAAKMIAEVSKTQEEEIGDGTTTCVMIAGKLLENAGKLIKKGIHPTVIIKGYNLAYKKCLETLKEVSIKDVNEEILINLANTAMTGKGAEEDKEHLSKLIVDGIMKAQKEEAIKIERVKGKSIKESELIEGMVIPNPVLLDSMPKEVKNAKILLLDLDLQVKSPELDTHVQITSPEQLETFVDSDKEKLEQMAKQIIDSKANVVICQKGIDDKIQHILAKNNIMAVRRVAKFDMEHLELATSGKIVSDLNDLEPNKLGQANVKEEKSKEGSLLYLRECKNPKAFCILLCATTSHILDEIRRAVTDALGDVFNVYKEKQVIAGGGAIEIELSKRLNEYSTTFNGREQLAIQEFANALESIPEALAENAGLDSINVLTELKQKNKEKIVGLNLFNNKIEDTFKAGIIEPTKIKSQAISSATEITNSLLRVDDVLISKSE